nr:hypothetical protein [Tanacetum cinerariifolium]
MDFIEKYMIETILHQQEIQQLLNEKKLQTQEVKSNTVQGLKVNLVVMKNTCSGKENYNSETACSKSVKESSLDSNTKDVHAIKYKMSKAKERCITYFRSLHSHLQFLFIEELKGTRIEHRFKQAFMSLFGNDDDTFTKSCRTDLKMQDESSMSVNDTDADDTDTRPIYDEEPMAKPHNAMSTKVPTTNMIVIKSMIDLEIQFGPLFDEYFNGENQLISKSSDVTTADASDKRQQQLDSTSSTSTLATTVSADENFDL